MTDDEAIALYRATRKLVESISAREAALDKKTGAPDAAIDER